MLPANAFFNGIGTVIFEIDNGLNFSIPAGYIITSGSDISYVINSGDGDGLTFTGSSGDDEINLGQGSQTANGGDGNDVLNNGFSTLPGAGLISMFGGNGDDILVLDNTAEGNVLLDGGAGTDLLQIFGAATPTTHNISPNGFGSGVTGIEAVQFVSSAGAPTMLIAGIDASFGTIIGGAGFDQMIFGITTAGTYTMPNFTLLNWNSAGGDFVGFGLSPNATFSVTLNGRNDIGQFFFGGLAADIFNGGALSDRMFGGAGADIYNGNGGNDFLTVAVGADGSTYNGGDGIDTLVVNGSAGSFAGVTSIEAIQLSSGANLTLTGSQFANGLASNSAISGSGTITVNMDTGVDFFSTLLAYSGTGVNLVVNGTSGTDVIKAGNVAHTLNGGGGSDQITGGLAADTINGGDGNDKITGRGGADILTGGAGADIFRYIGQANSGVGAAADRITDFTIGSDLLGFTLIDADAVTPGDQAFSFIGTGAFANTGVGQIRYTSSGADLLVQADVNGDGIVDIEIILQGIGAQTLTAADFLL
jgi:Ca2+-binding RTX toxin-like protein